VIKPWAIADEPDAIESPRAGLTDAPRDALARQAPPAPADDSNPVARTVSLNPRWAYVPLLAAVGWAVWGAVHPATSGRVAVLAPAGLTLLGLALLRAGLVSQRRDLQHLSSSVRHESAGSAGGRNMRRHRIASDLRPLQDELLTHLDRLADALKTQHDRGVELGYRLAETEHRSTQAIIDSLPDAVLVIDNAERVIMANPAACGVLKMPDPARRELNELISDPELLQSIRQAFRAPPKSRRQAEQTIDGQTYRLALYCIAAAPAQAERGGSSQSGSECAQLVITLRDVSKEKEAAKVTTEFVSHVAHELRTPLSSLKAYVEMLVDGESTDAATCREYYEIIQTETDRMSRLIDNILNISRIESGLIKVAKTPVAMAVVVREVVDIMRPQAEMKKIKLVDDLVPVMHEVHADRDMLQQAVLNLVSNAVKYTPEGGSVWVRMKINEQERAVRTEVTDTGVGIPEADLPRMFEKFFRVSANTKIAKGTGLGLNLVRNIVETIHGGKVGLASTVGKGSTFWFALPLI